jgi:hypothetical protein
MCFILALHDLPFFVLFFFYFSSWTVSPYHFKDSLVRNCMACLILYKAIFFFFTSTGTPLI